MDELKKALKSEKIVSCGFGDGTAERGWFWWNKETQQMERLQFGPPKEVNAPYVISDEMAPTMSMTGTDKIYTSKRAIRREYKERGFVEMGELPNLGPPPCPFDQPKYEKVRDTVLRAANDIKYNNAPVTEQQRQFYKDEERRCKKP